MPRAALSNVPLKQLVGELNKRKAKLAILVKQRDALDEEIAELEGLATQPSATESVPAPKAKKGRKPKAKKVAKASKPAAKAKTGKKRTFACPTCKQVFASGIMVGQHYKAEPTHRIK